MHASHLGFQFIFVAEQDVTVHRTEPADLIFPDMTAEVTRPSAQPILAMIPVCRKWIEGSGRQGVSSKVGGTGGVESGEPQLSIKKGGSIKLYSMMCKSGKPCARAASENATVRARLPISRMFVATMLLVGYVFFQDLPTR